MYIIFANNPGSYLMNEGETVYDLAQAGGHFKNVYPFGGIFINQNAKEVNQRNNDKFTKIININHNHQRQIQRPI